MKFKKIIGALSFVLGFVLILNSFSGITGYIIAEQVGKSVSSILGLVFILGGLGLFMSERDKIESKIEQLVSSGVSKTQINEIQKKIKSEYRKLSKDKRKKIYEEIANVIGEIKRGNRKGGSYNLHILKKSPEGLTRIPSNLRLLSADAKVLNNYLNQKGRGTERYIFDSSTGKLLGIARHAGGVKDSYNWRKRF